MSKADEIETNRERFICWLYKKSDGKARVYHKRDQIMEELGVDLDTYRGVIKYFRDRECIIDAKLEVALSEDGANYAAKLCEGK